ncbi:MAG: autotransporter domain-containing protein [Alphaproteobacteria bacterium]
MTSSTQLSVLVALLAALALPVPALAEAFDDDPEIEAGADSNNGANNISITTERIFELSDNDGSCTDEGRTAVLSEVETTNINIGGNGVVEIDDSACQGTSLEYNAIRVNDGTSGEITINGRVSVPDAASNAVFVEQEMGTTEITIGNNGQVDGAITLGQGGDHSLTNDGVVNGGILFLDSDSAATATQIFTNNGTLNATTDNRAILIDNTAHTVEDDNNDTVLFRGFNVVVSNEGAINGNIDVGVSGEHTVQNLSEATITGTVTFQGGDNAPLESVGGTYQNLGTHTAGASTSNFLGEKLAIHVEADRTATNVTGGLNADTGAHDAQGVGITNNFSGFIDGSILIEGADSDSFTNQGTMQGRVWFEGEGSNAVSLSSGHIYLLDDGDTDTHIYNPTVYMGAGNDLFTLSGGTVSATANTEDVNDSIFSSMISLDEGDDRAMLISGTILSREDGVALHAGSGDDRVILAPNGAVPLFIQGEIDGGTGTDTLEVRGSTDGSTTTISGALNFDSFENFDVTSGAVALDYSEGGALFVLGGSLDIAENASLDLGEHGSISSDNGVSEAHFNISSGRNDGSLVFRADTQLLNEAGSATFTNGEDGSMLFTVRTETDEEGVTTIANAGRFFDPRTYQGFGESSAAGVVASEGARLTLERGSSLGLALDTKSLATDLNPNADFFSPVAIQVVTSAGLVVADGPTAAEPQSDVVVTNAAHLEDIMLLDENPFYAFEYQVQNTGSQTIVSILASRTPGLAQTLSDGNYDVGAGTLLDNVFDLANAAGCQNNANVDPALCALDADVRALAPRSAQTIDLGVRALEPNRHSGLWQGLLANQQMTLGTVALRSATVRADAGGMAAPTQYALISDPAQNPDLGGIAARAGISGVNAGNIWEANRFWIQAFGSISDRERSDSDVGHETANVGVVFGYDRRLTRTGLLGIFGSYGAVDIESKGADGEEITINAFNGGIYYTTFNRTASAEFSLAGGVSQMEGERAPLGGGRAAYEADGWNLSFRAAADTNMKARRLLITPNAALQYSFMNQGGYDEVGTSPSLLSVESINMHSLETVLGVNVGLPSRLGKLAALPKFKFNWAHEFLDDTSSVDASLLNIPSAGSFSAGAVEVPADRVTTGLGLDLASRGGTTFTVGYDFTIGSDYMAHTGAATFRFPF